MGIGLHMNTAFGFFETTPAAGPEMGAYAVRNGIDGATRKAHVLPVSYLEAGVDIAKTKAA